MLIDCGFVHIILRTNKPFQSAFSIHWTQLLFVFVFLALAIDYTEKNEMIIVLLFPINKIREKKIRYLCFHLLPIILPNLIEYQPFSHYDPWFFRISILILPFLEGLALDQFFWSSPCLLQIIFTFVSIMSEFGNLKRGRRYFRLFPNWTK